MTKRKWTKADIRTMKSLAGKKTRRTIARELRRSEAAIATKASTLGVSLSTR
jgi:hypothetical protein